VQFLQTVVGQSPILRRLLYLCFVVFAVIWS